MRKLSLRSLPPITQSLDVPDASPTSLTVMSRSLADTVQLGKSIGESAEGGEIFALYGDLGTGKTAFVRGLARGVGAGPGSVTSPTFVLIHEYHGRLRLAHVDLYRLESPATLPHIGLEEYFDGRTVVAVEWAERAHNELPLDRLDIRFIHESRTERKIIFTAVGPRAHTLFAGIAKRLIRGLQRKPARRKTHRAKPAI